MYIKCLDNVFNFIRVLPSLSLTSLGLPVSHFLFLSLTPFHLCLFFVYVLFISSISNLLITPCSSANLPPPPPPPPPSLPSVSSFPASRIRRGGPGRRPAALLREGVLVVSSHVEPHAAPPIPQPVGAGRADVAEQEVCHGMLRTRQMSYRSITKLKANKPRYDTESSSNRSARCRHG